MAGDGGGNYRRPAFLQQVNSAFGFGGKGVEFGGLMSKEGDNFILLIARRCWYPEINGVADVELLLRGTVLDNFNLEPEFGLSGVG